MTLQTVVENFAGNARLFLKLHLDGLLEGYFKDLLCLNQYASEIEYPICRLLK